MISIIAAILVFSLIVLFHEFGHFLMARRSGVCVLEFSLGMGPRIVSFVRGGTRYSLKALPLGGSCMMLGEDEADVPADMIPPDAVGLPFGKVAAWKRFLVIAGGPVFNFILAFFCACFVIGLFGYDRPEVSGIMEGYPAEEAGLMPGDAITELNGHNILIYRDITAYIMTHEGKDLRLTYERDGEKADTVIVPKYSADAGRYLIGITGGAYRKAENPLVVAQYGAYEVRYWIYLTWQSLGMLVRREVKEDDIGGPVKIVSMIGETVNESRPYGMMIVILNLASMCVFLSANLGVMNLLPFPALDGGRLVFIFLEMVRGKRVDPEIEGRIHVAGFMILMALMVVVFWHDLRDLFIK